MSDWASFVARWRVRLGYPLALLVLWFAQPDPTSIVIGAAVAFVGVLIRAYAAGYLHKQEVLTVTGPYAYTRNPLYFGSSILALGAAIAMRSWISAILLLAYFAIVYWVVMKREEQELRAKHREAFDQYAARVPLFFPKPSSDSPAGESAAHFSVAQYRKNHEQDAFFGFLLLILLLIIRWRMIVA